MVDISLQELLEAGAHFGHKSERWHPKAAQFIYTEKDGVHIIDLTKTKLGLEQAIEFIMELTGRGDELLFVGTKRQARGILTEEAGKVGAPYLAERWIGGFLTNWDSIKKNVEKMNRYADEKERGLWKKLPKHEQATLGRLLGRLTTYYGGVAKIARVPGAMFVVDVKKEDAAVREAHRRGIPVIAVVDTNASPEGVEYIIPANDDAVGSIAYIVKIIAQAYKEGQDAYNKSVKDAADKAEPAPKAEEVATKKEVKKEVVPESKPEEAKKKATKKVVK